MLDSLNLTPEELYSVTGKRRPGAQARALRQLGFEIKIRPDGKPILCREHYLRIMGVITNEKQKCVEPDFNYLNA